MGTICTFFRLPHITTEDEQITRDTNPVPMFDGVELWNFQILLVSFNKQALNLSNIDPTQISTWETKSGGLPT